MGQYDESIRKTRTALVEALNDYEEQRKASVTWPPSVAEYLLGQALARVNKYHAMLQTFIDADERGIE